MNHYQPLSTTTNHITHSSPTPRYFPPHTLLGPGHSSVHRAEIQASIGPVEIHRANKQRRLHHQMPRNATIQVAPDEPLKKSWEMLKSWEK